jgi:hypothetical protein
MAIDCGLPIGRQHADAISNLTGEAIEIETYSDAAHAIRRWFRRAPRLPGERRQIRSQSKRLAGHPGLVPGMT